MTNMTRRGFLTTGAAAIAFSGVATTASAQTNAQLAQQAYRDIRHLIQSESFQDAFQYSLPYMRADRGYAQMLTSLEVIRQTPHIADNGGAGVVAFCAAEGIAAFISTFEDQITDRNLKRDFTRIKRVASQTADLLNNHLYDGQANAQNCRRVYNHYLGVPLAPQY